MDKNTYTEIKIKKAVPMFNGMLITTDKYEGNVMKNGEIFNMKGQLKEIQTIVELGTSCHPALKKGMKIVFNPTRYELRQFEKQAEVNDVQKYGVEKRYSFNIVNVNGKDYIKCYDQDIDSIVEVEEVTHKMENKKGKLIKMSGKNLSL